MTGHPTAQERFPETTRENLRARMAARKRRRALRKMRRATRQAQRR